MLLFEVRNLGYRVPSISEKITSRRLGDWETGRWGDWEMGRLGDWALPTLRKQPVNYGKLYQKF